MSGQKEYKIDLWFEPQKYLDLFGVEEGLERFEAVKKNLTPLLNADTTSNICIFLWEAMERALRLKKKIDEQNLDLLIPYPVEWIVIHKSNAFIGIMHPPQKPIGNCGILLEGPVDNKSRIDDYTMYDVDDGFVCIEQRFFEVKKIHGNRLVIKEPILLRLNFSSKEDQIAQKMMGHYVRNRKSIDLFCEKLDAELIISASKVVSYQVTRLAEVLLIFDGEGNLHYPKRPCIESEANVIDPYSAAYCDSLDKLPSFEKK